MRLIGILEFSPESFHDVVAFIANAIPQRIVFPSGLDMLHKFRVFFPSLKRGDFKDGQRNGVLAGRTREDGRLLGVGLARGDSTAGMTRLTTAPQRGMIEDRCQTDHTWFGLRHQAKGSLVGLSERMLGSSMGVKHGGGRGFFIEKQKGHVGGKGPMRERPIMLWEGTGWGDPPPPSLDRP